MVTVAVWVDSKADLYSWKNEPGERATPSPGILFGFDWIERGSSRAEGKWEACRWLSTAFTRLRFGRIAIGIRMLASRRAEHRAIFSVRGRLQSDTSDEEALHCETGAVLSVYLLLHEDSRIRSLRIRHAELFQGIAAIGAPDGRHIGGQWFHRAGHGARSVDSSADSPGRTAQFGIGSVHVQQPAELFSSRRLLARDISGKLILIEYLPNGRKKSRQFLRELRLALGLVASRNRLSTVRNHIHFEVTRRRIVPIAEWFVQQCSFAAQC